MRSPFASISGRPMASFNRNMTNWCRFYSPKMPAGMSTSRAEAQVIINGKRRGVLGRPQVYSPHRRRRRATAHNLILKSTSTSIVLIPRRVLCAVIKFEVISTKQRKIVDDVLALFICSAFNRRRRCSELMIFKHFSSGQTTLCTSSKVRITINQS